MAKRPPARVVVRPATRADAEAWLALRRVFWPEGSPEEHRAEIEAFFSGGARAPQAVLLAAGGDGRVVGMAELSIRHCAEGCRTDRVAHLEGWYVAPEARRSGVGAALVAAARDWARAAGCSEMASDTRQDNETSAEAHRAVGFTEAARVLCFRMDL